MIRYCIAILLVVITACNKPTESTARVETPIKNLSFAIETVFLNSDTLIARGTVANIGTVPVISGFYVQGEFFTDSYFYSSAGEAEVVIDSTLVVGTSTSWELSLVTAIDPEKLKSPRIAKLNGFYVE